ncbi:MAG TPA: YbjN domain-containing protein [Gammaproteobacteria bacterium]
MRILFSALLLLPMLSACAEEEAPAPPPVPDPAVVALLEALEYDWESEDNGDFRLLFDVDGTRTQLVWIRNRTYERDDVVMRDVWSTALELSGKYASVKLADLLLRSNWERIIGTWAREGNRIVYMVKLPVNATSEQLDAAIGVVIDEADRLEKERGYGDKF